MKTQIERVLEEKFSFSSFRTGQLEAIESVLEGLDTLVMLPTGTGKSLCYQLPAYLMQGAVLVVSPLLSLMQDQVEGLRLRGEQRVVALNSMTPKSERNRIFKQFNRYKFIYTSPEMLQNRQVIEHLKQIEISLFVVDEAHCISHWGTDFRPDYLALKRIKSVLNSPTTMALTATATKRVREEIIQFLGLDLHSTNQIVQSVDREEIKYVVEICDGDKDQKLVEYIKQLKGSGIIYFTSKKLSDIWSTKLRNELGIRVSSYHADLDSDDRMKIQQQFLNNDLQIICATSAFGMGFDKKDIRFVIHYHLPGSLEMYLQEVGRASRDGVTGVAILFYQPGDEQTQRYFIESSLPSDSILKNIYQSTQNKLVLDDPLTKLALYFKESSKNIDEALDQIENRRAIKNKQLSYMLRYVFHEDCKRAFILNYFGENIDKKLEECCINCGLEVEDLFKRLNEIDSNANNAIVEADLISWKKVYNSLYNIS